MLDFWYDVMSKNKYDVGLTSQEYQNCVSNDTPVKSYVPRCTPAMIKAINKELTKMIGANFIKKSRSPYSAPTVCICKPNELLRVTIDFCMINKNIINDAYPMYRIDN